MKSCFTEKLEDSVLCQTWYKVQRCNTPEPTLDLYEETVVLVTQPCPTLFDPMDCSPLGSPVHRISQARILEPFPPFPPPGDLANPGIKSVSPGFSQRSI